VGGLRHFQIPSLGQNPLTVIGLGHVLAFVGVELAEGM
jgi:hypothetical protein